MDKKCIFCSKDLNGRQLKFCCIKCKSSYNNYNCKGEIGNKTYYVQKEEGYKRKKEFIELKGGGCQICGYDKSLRALSFHHRDPSVKSFQLDIRNLSNRSYDNCVKEMNKCDLLCSNCHMELHENEELEKIK